MYVCMAKKLTTWINEIKNSLEQKGYTKDIHIDIFKTEFMILSGYNKSKVNEWVENFNMCKLITIKDNKVNFHMK